MSLIKKILNIPFVWNIFQTFVGANAWKLGLYPSVFHTKGKLLDFGCSMGNSTAAFADFDYLGIDVDCEAIAAAARNWSTYPNIRFVCADILEQPFPETDFDHVLVACAGHHLSDEAWRSILAVLFSKLKKGGMLHFFDPLSQPEKDNVITKLFIRNDQGRFIRTLEENKRFFKEYPIMELNVIPSPDRFIKLEDMLYVRLQKS
ncbi:MAG TPA: class I SAM-dependent methyltransferase [Candidatus Paceibacterota bacterium]